MKNILSAVLAASLLLPTAAYAFTFPEPDWGALYEEKMQMVTETDFELYVEGSTDTAPYYGARLEPRAGAYIGTVAEASEQFRPLGSYLTNIDEMNQDDLYYPANNMITNDDVVSMIGWTIYSLDNVDYEQVRRVLDNLSRYNKPMLIRFANEMNCSPLGDDPARYIEVFRRVADMIHEYPNFAVVWSPNDLGALDRPFEYYYPGDEYVDWVGVSCYMIQYFQGNPDTDYKNSVYFMTGDYAWATNKIKPVMDFMRKNNIQKPVMISEGGVATSSSYGNAYEAWSTPRFRNMLWYLVMKYPQIKMINYFNVYRADEVEKFDISNYGYAVDLFNEAAASGAYLRSAGDTPEFVFQPANSGGTLTAENGVVRLYTLAYFASQPDITVNYSIDGSWYHSAGQIPYICNLNVSGLSDGPHTLNISANGISKDYTFYKQGGSIRFGAAPQAEITVTLNGQRLSFDQPPVLINDRTLVPLRVIFESLGAEVLWDNDTQTVSARRGQTEISLQIGSDQLFVNGSAKTLDVPAQLLNNRTLVPVRAISEAFGCSVDWDNDTQTVIITE